MKKEEKVSFLRHSVCSDDCKATCTYKAEPNVSERGGKGGNHKSRPSNASKDNQFVFMKRVVHILKLKMVDIEKLIYEVYMRSPIWDQTNSLNHNRDVILKLWQEVADSCI